MVTLSQSLSLSDTHTHTHTHTHSHLGSFGQVFHLVDMTKD